MRSPRWLAALLALLTLVATACASEADDDPVAEPPIDATSEAPADGPVEGPNGFVPDAIAWEECGATECGVLDVPPDSEQPQGKLLPLFITRAPPEAERLGALCVTPGGPGARAAARAAGLPSHLPGETPPHPT